jgi:hypothetical protein
MGKIKSYLVSLFFLILTLSFSVNCLSQTKINGYANRGGLNIQINSVTSYKVQESYPNCTVTVYLAGTTTLATIYSNNIGTIKSNPFTADSTGYYAFYVNDGSYDIKFSGTGISVPFTISDITIINSTVVNTNDRRLGNIYNVKSYGAVCDWNGNGTGTDDTIAIQNALTAALAGRGTLLFPAFCKTTQTLVINKSIEITAGAYEQGGIVLAASAGNTIDDVRISPPATGNSGPNYVTREGRDNRGYRIHDISIISESGTSGRHGLTIDTSTVGQFIHNSNFENILFGKFGAQSLYLNNNGGGVPANHDGQYALSFAHNIFFDGVLGEFIGDSNRFRDNVFREYNSNFKALEISFVLGAAGFVFDGNNVYNKYGIQIHNGERMSFVNNMLEGPEVGLIGNGGAFINFDGDASYGQVPITGIYLGHNQINTLSGSVNGLRFNNVQDAVLDFNTYGITAGNYGYVTTSPSTRINTRGVVLTGLGAETPTPITGTGATYNALIYRGDAPAALTGTFWIEKLYSNRTHTNVTTYTTNATITNTDANGTLLMDCASGPCTVKLPPNNASQAYGRIIRIIKIDATGNVVTITRADGTSDVINTIATLTISVQGGCYDLQAADSGTWWMIGKCQ